MKKQLKRQLAQQKLLQVAVKADETVTDEEVKKFYADNGDVYFVRPEGLWVNYAVFSDGKTALEARDALAAGQPWDDVMKRYADKMIHSTPYDNPLLVPMTTIEAQKEMAPLKDLKVGQVSQPIQLDSDHVAIYLVKKYQHKERIPFEEVKDNIKLALSQQKVQAQRQAYLQGLIDKANIEIVDPSVFEAPKQAQQPTGQEESGNQGETTQNNQQTPTSQPNNQQSQQ